MSTTQTYDPVMPDTPNNAPQNWITRAEAAERLDVSTQTVDYYVLAGRLTRWQNPTTKRVWIKVDGVERVKADREATPE